MLARSSDFLKHAKARNFGLAVVVITAIVMTACAQSVPRNESTPTIEVSPQPTETVAPATSTPTEEPTASPTLEPTATATVTPTITVEPSPSPTPTITPTPGLPTAIPVNDVKTYTLTLEIEGLSDESIVYGDSIVARGQTSPDAIVSVNGVIVPVSDTGSFEVAIKLDPGPNLIEVVASDLEGNQISTTITVVSLLEELP